MLSSLQQAQQDLHNLLQDLSHRGEAKAWLVHSLAQLQHVSRAARWACFLPCNDNSSSSRSNSSSPVASCREAELHLLQLLAELAPADVSTLLLRDPDWVCSFLTASTDRVKAWFGGFGPTSIQHFKYGARALANYALAERADAWRHLVWSGKHSQSPVAVAAKPHYFGELDVVATVRNLVRSCPRFWSSEELMRSCQAGDWLAFDRDAVAKELLRLLHDRRSSRQQPLQQLLSSFLVSTDWGQLCQRLLPLLPDSALLQVACTAAQDMHNFQVQQQQRKQQRQGRHRQDAQLLMSCWCSKQCSFCANHAVAAAPAAALPPAGQAPGGYSLQQEHLAALQAAAVAAPQLPCVSEPQPLLLACLQASQEGGSGWTLDQLLLANALTCCRSQLLSLLRQDEDTAGQLMALATAAAAAAAAAMAPGTATAAAGTAASAASDHSGGTAPGAVGQLQPSQVAAAVRQIPRVQQLLLLLVGGWLLRLHLLLQLSGAAGDAVDGAPGQQQCARLPVQLPTGGSCHMYMPTPTATAAAAAAAATTDAQAAPMTAATRPHVADAGTDQPEQELLPQPPQQQQQQQQPKPQDDEEAAQQKQQQQQQQSPQQHAPRKTPLRRGPSASAGKDRPARAGSTSSDSESGSDSSSRHKQRSSSRHKRRRSHKHKRHRHSKRSSHSKRRRKRSRSSSSGSSSGGSQRRARKRRRRLHSSDDDGSSSDGEWAGLDLDAGGELLDPAAFQGPPHSGGSSKPQRPAVGAPLGEQGGGATTAAAAGGVLQQEGVQPAAPGLQGLQLLVIEERLASLAVGGRLWQRPQCLVQLPCSWFVGGGSNAEGEGGQVLLSGSVTEVADAVAQLWLCAVLPSVLAGQQSMRA